MKRVLIALGILQSGDMGKYIAVTVATLAVVLALPFLAVLSMGSEALAFLNSTTSAEHAEQEGFYMGDAMPGNTYAWGNCTYWVFAMRYWNDATIPTAWGNANTWDERAIRDGYIVNKTPEVGAIMQSDEGEYGHVAYVVAVDKENGKWTISEMNAPTLNVVSKRTFAANSAIFYDFIHGKKDAPWKP